MPGSHDHVCDLLLDAARAHPDAPAVTDEGGTWTFAQLLSETRSAAALLGEAGVGPGDRVLSRLGNTRVSVAALLGTLWLGAAHVPINPAMTEYHLSTVLLDADPVLSLTTGDDVERLNRLSPGTALDWVGAAGAWEADSPAGGGDDLALLIYTSGSTSAPKAVASPHRAIRFAAAAIAARLGYRDDDVVLVGIPLAFDYGLYQLFLALIGGSHLVLGEPGSTLGIRSLLYRHGVTILPAVPSLAEIVVRLAGRGRSGPPPIRMVTNTGAALTAGLIRQVRTTLPGAQIVPMFGTTECKRITILEPDGDLVRPGSVGRALDGTRVLILDDDGRELGPGEVGEIVVEGPHIMDGYWRAPEISAQRFRLREDGEKRLHTGDYGHLDAEGYLYFEGRRDDLFKRRGHRVSTTEIESATVDVPGVESAAALAPSADHDLTVFAVREPGADVTPDDVLAGLASRLEAAKVPGQVLLIDALPLTPNGKTDRKALAGVLTGLPVGTAA